MKIRKALFKSTGGAHPAYHKNRTAGKSIEIMPVPSRILVSMSQHLGAPAKPLVKKGDAVSRGQPLGEPAGFVSSWIHAPVSGVVKAVDEMPTAGGRFATVIEMESNGQDTLHESCQAPAGGWESLDRKGLVDAVARAGIVGMGGAGFPTQVKLSPPPGKTIDTLLLNGAECEPYLTADHQLMVEQADRIWKGACVVRKILNAGVVRVAIEDNKPDAIQAMERAMAGAEGDVEIVVLKTEYPQGAEKQLIYSATGREVPSGGLPMDVRAVVENVATCAAIWDAMSAGLPLMERVVTVTGDAVKQPRNLLARVGTPLQDLVAFCGGSEPTPAKIICGGPMMGLALSTLDVGMQKTTSGVLLLPPSELEYFTSMPCIACGRCVGACPMRLMPCRLSEAMEAEDYAAAEAENVLDCIECGSCAFECPAHRPLVQHMKLGKAQVTALRREREARKKG